MNIYLDTPRLVLRRLTEGDAMHLHALDSDPEVLRHVGARPLSDVAAYRRLIRCSYLCYYVFYEGYGFWAVVEKTGGQFAGWFCLRPALDARWAGELGYGSEECELSCRLRRAVWRQGYATEVASALLGKAFAELGTPRVVTAISTANGAAARVSEKVGLRRHGGPLPLPGWEQPAVVYALGKREFERGRRRP